MREGDKEERGEREGGDDEIGDVVSVSFYRRHLLYDLSMSQSNPAIKYLRQKYNRTNERVSSRTCLRLGF